MYVYIRCVYIYIHIQQSPKSWTIWTWDDVCWFCFFPRLWGWRTIMFQLSGFYCVYMYIYIHVSYMYIYIYMYMRCCSGLYVSLHSWKGDMFFGQGAHELGAHATPKEASLPPVTPKSESGGLRWFSFGLPSRLWILGHIKAGHRILYKDYIQHPPTTL